MDLKEEISLAFSSLKALVGAVDLLNKPPIHKVTALVKRYPSKARSKLSDDSISSTEGDNATCSTQ